MEGEVTGLQYEPLAGVDVTVKNVTTGEDETVTADTDGLYSVDLDDVAAFPSGGSAGDEVHVTATHAEMTRTWKHRRHGAGPLVQDIYFTHGTWRGALQKAKMLVFVSFTGLAGTTVTFRDARTRTVVEVKKNGTLLTEGTDYTFTPPRTLELTTALVSGDVLEILRAVDRSKTDAQAAIVADGEPAVRAALARHYPTPFGPRVPVLVDASQALAAARLRHEVYSSRDKVDEEAKNLERGAEKALGVVEDGRRGLVDTDGNYIVPSVQAETNPGASPASAPERKFERFDDDRVVL